MNNVKDFVKSKLLFLILIAQPLLDILAYIQEGSAISFAGYVRLAITIFVPIYTLIAIKKKKRFFIIMCVIGVFAMLHVANGFRVGYIGMFDDIKYMLLVLHMPILLFSFMYLYTKEENVEQITDALKINMIVITLTFFASYFLKSGKYTYEIYEQGWTGWYAIPNAQSVIMVSLLPFAVYFVIKYFKKAFPIPMIALIFMYIENGTKSAFYGMVLILIGFFCFIIFEFIVKREGKLPLYTLSMLLVLALGAIFAYNYSPRMILDSVDEATRLEEQVKLDEEEDDPEELMKYLDEDLVDRFGEKRVLDAYGDEISSYTLADMRLKKRIYGKLVWEENDFLTKLVGYEYSQMQYNDNNFDLENDPHAILYYYGYIGAGMYICLFGYFMLRLINMLIKSFKECLNLFEFSILITWGLQLGLSVYTGYLLRRPNVAIYLMAMLLLVYCCTISLRKGSEL